MQIAKKLVSRENGYKQMFIVLNSFAGLILKFDWSKQVFLSES